MKFLDPCLLECPRCGAESSQREAALLALTAVCPVCDTSFDDVGRKMRTMCDGFWNLFVVANFAVELQYLFGIEITDPDFDNVVTLRDLAQAVQQQLRSSDAEAKSWEYLIAAGEQVQQHPAGRPFAPYWQNCVNVPLLAGLLPDRWSRP